MENQTQLGQEISVDDVDKEQEQSTKDSLKASRFRKIEPGKTATLTFTGKIRKRTATGTDEKGVGYSAEKYDYELVDTVQEGDLAGQNKVFSIGVKNKVVREINANIRAGHETMLISRKGEGKSTKYEVTTPE